MGFAALNLTRHSGAARQAEPGIQVVLLFRLFHLVPISPALKCFEFTALRLVLADTDVGTL